MEKESTLFIDSRFTKGGVGSGGELKKGGKRVVESNDENTG